MVHKSTVVIFPLHFYFLFLFFVVVVLMEPRDFFLKALALHGYPLGRQVMAKLNLLPQLLSTFVCVCFPVQPLTSALQITALIITALLCRLRAGSCMELDSIYVFVHNPLAHRPC